MVMEKIATPTLSDCGISEEKGIDYAASAVKWLLDQSLSVPETFSGGFHPRPHLYGTSFLRTIRRREPSPTPKNWLNTSERFESRT